MDGFAHEDFERVRSVFAENFTERDEVGAAVAVYLEGEPVVDLWGGVTIKDGERAEPWERDTLVCMASVNKGLTAICAHRLIDLGKLDYDKPVANYWPEFAQAGKDEVTVRQLIGGWAALIFPDEVPDGKAFDWEAMVDGLAKQGPAWPVGTRWAYHSSTYGHLVGELVRRVSGQMPDGYFRKEIGDPLGIDYWFTLPEGDRHRFSEMVPDPDALARELDETTMKEIQRQWRVMPSADILGLMNDPRYLHELMPSAWGKGNARALGKLFAALSVGGTLDGYTVLSPETLAEATTLQWEGSDSPDSELEVRAGMGLNLNTPGRYPMGPNRDAFGTNGVGDSVGFADPDRRVAFGYCSNCMGTVGDVSDRCQALIEATFASIEGTSSP